MRMDHQTRLPLACVEGQAQAEQLDHPENSGWSHCHNPAVRELLDHVAAELASEYIRLMEAPGEPKEAKG